jgi:hypothetical protein
VADGDLIYSPAKRGNVGVLIMLAGPSGSGKTKSALRLATGLAGGKLIGFCDTEHGRALYYADEFSFLHGELKEPFTPKRFEAAAVASQRAGHSVWVCDSFSHEHVGPGGVLDMFNDELNRMTKGDLSKQEALKYAAWIKPKMEHKHLLQRLWQLNAHIVLCCHAEKKLDLIKDRRGKMVPNPDATPTPVCAPDIPFAMTCSFLLDAKNPGVPTWLKRLDKLDHMIDLTAPLDEATGERIAAWARGDTVAPIATRPARQRTSRGDVPTEEAPDGSPDYAPDYASGPPDEEVTPPPDGAASSGPDPKMIAWVDSMVERFLGTPDLQAHLAIVDDAEMRTRIEWLRNNQRDLYRTRLKPAIDASVQRNSPSGAPTQQPTEQTEELPL